MFADRVSHDLFYYELEYSKREKHNDIINERKAEYLTNLYHELVASNDDSVISCYYDDNTVEFYTLDEFIESMIDSLDNDEFDY